MQLEASTQLLNTIEGKTIVNRTFAVTLGALAMALVAMRGAVQGEAAGNVATEAIAAMFIFAAVGCVAGLIADYLVRDSLEQAFRKRVRWYQDGIAELHAEVAKLDKAKSRHG